MADPRRIDRLERIDYILECYANDLRRLIQKERNFSIPPIYSIVIPIYREVLFLERLIVQNKIAGHEKLWKKYEKQYWKLTKEHTQAMVELIKKKSLNE